jgi:hypothetical protein
VTVYLGVASFIYILETLKKRYYISNGRSVTVSALKSGAQTFSFTEYGDGLTDCGFIITNTGVLQDIFDDSELSKVLVMCERKHNQNSNITSHCVIKNNPELKNNISTITDGLSLNCKSP